MENSISKDVVVEWVVHNEESCRYDLNLEISKNTVSYIDSTSAQRSPLAAKIFGFPWTKTVEIGPNFVAIAKHDWVDWNVLAQPLGQLIKEHFVNLEASLQSQSREFEENPEIIPTNISHPLAEPMAALIDNEINPGVAGHGGYIRLIDIKDDTVFISMEGGCQGCGMSKMTLKEGIVTTIQKYFPQIKDVVDITDHAQGQNPYY